MIIAGRYTALPRNRESQSSVPALVTVAGGPAPLIDIGNVVVGTRAHPSNHESFALTTTLGATVVVPPGWLWHSGFPSNRAVS